MGKLINLIHPHEVEKIKNINDYLIVLKNILRLSSKGMVEKKDGILIPVRWSINKKSWVVDRGTDLFRDIEGINKNNIDKYYLKENPLYEGILFTLDVVENSKSLQECFLNYNLTKNENKFFCFEYCNKKTNIIENETKEIFPIGLFQRCKTKKRSGVYSKNYKSILIDNCEKTLNNVTLCSENISEINFFNIKNYIEVFSNFLKLIKNKDYVFNLKDKTTTLNINDILQKSINKEISHDEILSFIKDNSIIEYQRFTKININVMIYIIYFEFINFIKKNMNISNKDIEGFIVSDSLNNILYKLTGDFMLKVFLKNKKEKELLPPLLPGVF